MHKTVGSKRQYYWIAYVALVTKNSLSAFCIHSPLYVSLMQISYFLKRSQNDWFWHYVLKILEIPSLEIDFIIIYNILYHKSGVSLISPKN